MLMATNTYLPGRLCQRVTSFSILLSAILFLSGPAFAGGCGSGWTDYIVPDNPLGYEFNGACDIHDKCYETCGDTKAICDLNFRDNMGKTCELQNKLAKQRMRRAQAYIDKAAKYPRYRVFTRGGYLGKAAWETAKAARAKLQYAACSTLKATYYSAVYTLGNGPYCRAQRTKKCCPLPKGCEDYYFCPKPTPPQVTIVKPTKVIIVDSGQWCSYWPWKLPGGVFTPDGETPRNPFTPDGWNPPPEHRPPGLFFPGSFIPEHVNTPEHKKHPKPKPEHAPTTYVKVKKSVIENGKINSKPVAGAQFKFSSLAPDLPVAGNKKTDDGFNKDPVQGVSDKNGNIILGGKDGNKTSQSGSPSVAGLFDTIGGIGEAVAATKRNTLQITIPSIKSYIIRIKANRNKRNWKKPSSYLSKKAAKYVVRSWVAGNILYAVVAVPRHAGESQ